MISSRFARQVAAVLGFAAVLWGSMLSSNAGQKSATLPPPADRRILVTAVDVPHQKITITYQRDKSIHVYIVDDMTSVKAHGNTGTIKDIKVGDQVYSYIERDDVALSSIDVSLAEQGPAAPVKAPAKKKPAPAAN